MTTLTPGGWCRLLVLIGLLPVGMHAKPGVAVLLVDTDRVAGQVDERVYGQFLEEINHSTVDGLYAEQIRGQGFEAKDFTEFWTVSAERGDAGVVPVRFARGEQSVRLSAIDGQAILRQERIHLREGVTYDGSLWVKPEQGALTLQLRVKDSVGQRLAELPLATHGSDWQEVPFSFESLTTDGQAQIEIVGAGTGSVLIDFVSLMRADARANGKMRPDLLAALQALKPPFIRWPGGSYASIYKWQDGIGPAVERKMNPNTEWGSYSDYYGFGTDEFMEMCRQLGSEPLIVLSATNTDPAQVEYAMNWVRYLLDPPSTEWGKRRAANGHPAPYVVPYIQIDNEPMNHKLSPDAYAQIVNVYGPRLRKLAPNSKIVACGQKRSNDLNWSQKLIDLAGDNFDILGCHNYEYEPENYASGVRRIEDYLLKLGEYIRTSAHPKVKIAVLEWGLCRAADWRAGLHAAGSLLSYEKLSPTLDMACPALLLRNTSDNPEWRAWIYHDHVSSFTAGGYVAQKLFRDHYAPKRYAFTSGTFKDLGPGVQADKSEGVKGAVPNAPAPSRRTFFDDISQMKPEDWTPDTVDAIATGDADGKRIVLKAVNYAGQANTLLVRLQGKSIPANAKVTITSITAPPTAENSLAEPDRIKSVETTQPYARDMAFDLAPYTVAVVEIRAE